MRNKVTKILPFGEHTLKLETGDIARQALAAVMVTLGDTVVLVTVCVKSSKEPRDFFPLTVNFQTKYYAAGRIPGGFLKREGRPTEDDTLISRLIDRPIRPLFVDGFSDEVQIIATLMSLDPHVPADIPAIIGASAALALSGLPFNGPIGACRVGFKDGIYQLNPHSLQIAESKLDLVVAGTEHAVLMVESEAKELSEQVMLGAVTFGHDSMQPVIKAIKEMAADGGVTPWAWTASKVDPQLLQSITNQFKQGITDAYLIRQKLERYTKMGELRKQCVTQFASNEVDQHNEATVAEYFNKVEKSIVRENVLRHEPRIDGRDNKTVRPIHIKTGILPRTHGSAIFTRGETQAIVVTTLGSERDSQMMDSLQGEYRDHFMLHYNFPPYCVGETGMMAGPKRREIGHGKLARRAIEAVLPSLEAFPYTLRVVSEITESNGSSSMATVCGTSLALMDAGVPIKAPVAGIAMGLVKEGDRFTVLTDILGDEDHLGDMDFKVAGTFEGVTALQMDIKIEGITREIMQQALEQAYHARLHILEIMNQQLSQHRQEMSAHAPRIVTMHINPDKIRDVIGKGGATIRALTEEAGVTIDINDEGVVKIFATANAAADLAVKRIEQLTEDLTIGKIYEGKVMKIVDFGAFVNLIPGKDGLLHISQIAPQRIEKVSDVLSEGQMVKVKVLDIDRQGKVKLSKIAADAEISGSESQPSKAEPATQEDQ